MIHTTKKKYLRTVQYSPVQTAQYSTVRPGVLAWKKKKQYVFSFPSAQNDSTPRILHLERLAPAPFSLYLFLFFVTHTFVLFLSITFASNVFNLGKRETVGRSIAQSALAAVKAVRGLPFVKISRRATTKIHLSLVSPGGRLYRRS